MRGAQIFLLTITLAQAAACGGSGADPRYCDESTPCADPAFPYCHPTRHECAATPWDGGAPDGAALDASRGDAGCPAGRHACSGLCVPDDDRAHCGAACVACQAPTPACVAGTCACTATSCAPAEVCAAGACVSGTCTTAADCTTPPPCRVTAGAICNTGHVC